MKSAPNVPHIFTLILISVINSILYGQNVQLSDYTKGFVDTFNALPMGKLEDIEKLEQLRALEYGHRIKVVESKWDSPEVDLPGDIAIMEALLQTGH